MLGGVCVPLSCEVPVAALSAVCLSTVHPPTSTTLNLTEARPSGPAVLRETSHHPVQDPLTPSTAPLEKHAPSIPFLPTTLACTPSTALRLSFFQRPCDFERCFLPVYWILLDPPPYACVASLRKQLALSFLNRQDLCSKSRVPIWSYERFWAVKEANSLSTTKIPTLSL